MRAHIGEGPGYRYMIGRGPKFCLFCHVKGPFFCLYVELFLPSIFDSVDFWSFISSIVFAIELADKNVIVEMGFSID